MQVSDYEVSFQAVACCPEWEKKETDGTPPPALQRCLPLPTGCKREPGPISPNDLQLHDTCPTPASRAVPPARGMQPKASHSEVSARRSPDTHSPASWGPVAHPTTTDGPGMCASSVQHMSNCTCSSEQAVKHPQSPDKQQSLSNFLDENSWQSCPGKSQCTVAASPAYAGPSGRELQTTCRYQKDFCVQSWQNVP